jgi:hypothetical protein
MWSTVVDAPVSGLMNFEEFERYYAVEYGVQGMGNFGWRVDRAMIRGTSSFIDHDLRSLVSCNRLGPDGACSSLEEIIDSLFHRYAVKEVRAVENKR